MHVCMYVYMCVRMYVCNYNRSTVRNLLCVTLMPSKFGDGNQIFSNLCSPPLNKLSKTNSNAQLCRKPLQRHLAQYFTAEIECSQHFR